jgi:hypothetical protein
MKRLLVVLAVWCSACGIKLPVDPPVGGGSGGSGGTGGTGGSGGSGGNMSQTPPDLSVAVQLFSTVSGGATRLLADVGNSRLEIDPTVKDPLTGLAGCADLISYCYAPPSVDVADCFARSRKCTTAEPWNESSPCCPAACSDAFDAEVAAGMGHVDALEKVLFREPDCFPGVRAALEAP